MMVQGQPRSVGPSVAVEDYLRGIFALQEGRGGPASTTDLARRLGLSISAVSGMTRRLRDAGLVVHHRYGSVALSEEGLPRASSDAATPSV
jgi:DtxR family Mn-dependent transcriptional regulator